MDTAQLKKFAQQARQQLIAQVIARLDYVLAASSPARRESPKAVADLEQQIAARSREQVAERAAYTWFNRFCALRFMDLNNFTRVHVVSPADESLQQPEVLAEAKAGFIDPERVPQEATRQHIQALLSGQAPSNNADEEAYRLLLVAECNALHRAMPYLFQRIDDYTELLLPTDLLAAGSVLSQARQALTLGNCQDVEVIGWLYQFYISERKDEVFAELKNGKKITPQNIPAATQLFTPHWIVRYLVENSLGRLWMLNHPGSRLVEQMEYYIPAEGQESDFLSIDRPEDIKVCDPACGSGHMLTYAFDLLYAIYEEVGTNPADIPGKILTHNLYGIELDERAGELAAFALTMKARAQQRRFFSRGIRPNICVLESVRFADGELDDYIAAVGSDLFTKGLQQTLQQFAEADNFGSLIQPAVASVADTLRTLEEKNLGGHLFLSNTHRRALKVLQMADYLSPRYHVVVANPPYMGSKNMNARIKSWASAQYPDSKSDLFAMFIERNLNMTVDGCFVAMITMQSWMFLSSFEKLRARILDEHTILSMAHLGARAFDSIGGEVVSTTAFVLANWHRPNYRGAYMRLIDGNSEADKIRLLKLALEQAGG